MDLGALIWVNRPLTYKKTHFGVKNMQYGKMGKHKVYLCIPHQSHIISAVWGPEPCSGRPADSLVPGRRSWVPRCEQKFKNKWKTYRNDAVLHFQLFLTSIQSDFKLVFIFGSGGTQALLFHIPEYCVHMLVYTWSGNPVHTVIFAPQQPGESCIETGIWVFCVLHMDIQEHVQLAQQISHFAGVAPKSIIYYYADNIYSRFRSGRNRSWFGFFRLHIAKMETALPTFTLLGLRPSRRPPAFVVPHTTVVRFFWISGHGFSWEKNNYP